MNSKIMSRADETLIRHDVNIIKTITIKRLPQLLDEVFNKDHKLGSNSLSPEDKKHLEQAGLHEKEIIPIRTLLSFLIQGTAQGDRPEVILQDIERLIPLGPHGRIIGKYLAKITQIAKRRRTQELIQLPMPCYSKSIFSCDFRFNDTVGSPEFIPLVLMRIFTDEEESFECQLDIADLEDMHDNISKLKQSLDKARRLMSKGGLVLHSDKGESDGE